MGCSWRGDSKFQPVGIFLKILVKDEVHSSGEGRGMEKLKYQETFLSTLIVLLQTKISNIGWGSLSLPPLSSSHPSLYYFFLDRVLLCSPGWSGVCYEVQVGFESCLPLPSKCWHCLVLAFLRQVSCSPGWMQTHTAKEDQKLSTPVTGAYYHIQLVSVGVQR